MIHGWPHCVNNCTSNEKRPVTSWTGLFAFAKNWQPSWLLAFRLRHHGWPVALDLQPTYSASFAGVNEHHLSIRRAKTSRDQVW